MMRLGSHRRVIRGLKPRLDATRVLKDAALRAEPALQGTDPEPFGESLL
jgi:hypothetical protein